MAGSGSRRPGGGSRAPLGGPRRPFLCVLLAFCTFWCWELLVVYAPAFHSAGAVMAPWNLSNYGTLAACVLAVAGWRRIQEVLSSRRFRAAAAVPLEIGTAASLALALVPGLGEGLAGPGPLLPPRPARELGMRPWQRQETLRARLARWAQLAQRQGRSSSCTCCQPCSCPSASS